MKELFVNLGMQLTKWKEAILSTLQDKILAEYFPTLNAFLEKISASKEKEEEEIEILNPKQKTFVLSLIIVGFFLFLPLFLPYKHIILYTVQKNFKDIDLQLSKLNLNFLTSSVVEGLQVTTSTQQSIRLDKLNTNLGPLAMLSSDLDLNANIEQLQYSSSKFNVQIQNTSLDAKIQNFKEKLAKQKGSIDIKLLGINLKDMDWSSLNPLLSNEMFSEFQVFQINTSASLNNTKLKIEELKLRSNFFLAEISGTCILPKCVKMKMKICVEPTKNLAELNPTIFSMYQLAQASQNQSSDLCFDIRGDLNRPTTKPSSR